MKRVTLLLVPILLLGALVVAVAAEIPASAGQPSGVRTRLEQYSSSSLAGADTRVLVVTRAKRPWNLTRDLRWPVLGDSVYFQTDQPLTWSHSQGLSPLPFPPKEIWCALLESKGEAVGAPDYSVVLVALHMDMYNGDWLIHQAPADLFTMDKGLSALGCKLEMQ